MTSVYATKWYLTLFLGFPFGLATRIWDLFLFYGFDMLIVVAVALLQYFEGSSIHPLKLDKSIFTFFTFCISCVVKLLHLDYEACMQFLSKLPDTPINEDRLISITMQIWKQYWQSGRPGRTGFLKFREEWVEKQQNLKLLNKRPSSSGA